MGSYTPNYNLYKPDIGEVSWGDEINASTDVVDAILHPAATAGVGISIAAGQVITNVSPDQTVAITGGTNVTIGGTYPNFTITDNSQAADAGLTSLSGLVYTAPCFVKMTAADTYGLDTNVYLPQGLADTYVFVGNGSGVAVGVQMTGDVTISNTGVTVVGNDSHNHTVSTVSLSLDNLSDVTITAPTTDHILRYNGATWINGPETNVNGGHGVDYYYDTTVSDVGTYQTLNKSPQSGVEQDYTVVCNNNTVLLKEFVSSVDGLGGTQIDAGVWTFDVWAYADLLTLASNVQIEVYKRTTVPVETLLFTVTSETLFGALTLDSITSIQQAFAINATDRLVVKVYGVTLNTSNTTIHFAFRGTTHYSHINTPLVVRHNDLAGLQGGSATERYHMTLAQSTALHDAVTSGTGISVAGQVVSLASAFRVTTLNFVIDGSGSVITTGVKGDMVVDFACTINSVTLLADVSGSIVVDIWKDSYANFPATVADTITAAAKPTISAATKAQDSTLTGWTTSIAAGDVLRFNVDSAATITRVTVALKVTRT